jgi:hypothetical protein
VAVGYSQVRRPILSTTITIRQRTVSLYGRARYMCRNAVLLALGGRRTGPDEKGKLVRHDGGGER